MTLTGVIAAVQRGEEAVAENKCGSCQERNCLLWQQLALLPGTRKGESVLGTASRGCLLELLLQIC